MSHLVQIALATLVSEDLTCIAAGVLVTQGRLDIVSGTLACVAGIYFGDLLLFLAGRFLGRPAVRFPLIRRFVTPGQLERASRWLTSRGPRVVFLSRFAPGLRLPTYFAAGLLRVNFWRFALYLLLAAGIWTPLLVGFTVVVGGRAVRTALLAGGGGWIAVVAVYALWVGLRRLAPAVAGLRFRRRLAGFFGRKVRWEFWPPWAAYLPLIPYFIWLAFKHRSLTVFTAANPGMPSGGFLGESKAQILEHLDRVPGVVAAFALIPATIGPAARIRRASEFQQRYGLGFPVALKPDVGERGSGVAIVRSQGELESYLLAAEADTIVQEYVEGLEFGVFYCRYPRESAGHILSITEKRFPEVIGDGRSTIEELILRDGRAVCLASAYLSRLRRPPRDIPHPGELVRLTEVGSHCRGSVFLDGSRLNTEPLEAAIDRIGKSHPGFFFGRFDVRAPSLQQFQQGSFKVLELNGVGAEATHIYDPAVSLAGAYRVMFTQWRMAFEIGANHRELGASPTPLAELMRLVGARGRRKQGNMHRYAPTIQTVG